MNKQHIAIIDYGMGNLHSVAKALESIAPNHFVETTDDASRILAADRVVLPGVGAIRDCMAEMQKHGVGEQVKENLATGKPLLGICVGMQALLTHSEENNGTECLGVLEGYVKRFKDHQIDASNRPMKVPHMGWNTVKPLKPHPLWHGIEANSHFYFVHSYYAALHPQYTNASTEYGEVFSASISNNNLFATQFHPEKSHTAGLTLLKNFVQWNGHSD